ncbi:MAG: hypothetical protein HY293_01760 [Planctomycetes bacterium]|nr:hypothetical protein [Planctomycetota bacterium]
MNWTPAEQIARAVLYEGYLLYPYRKSALKNQGCWTIGVVAPGGSTGLDCLLEGPETPRLLAKVKFLQEAGDRIEERETSVAAGEMAVEPLGKDLFRLSLRIPNRSDAPMLSCHALLGVENGSFVSSTDPRAARCERRGLWPVLAGPAPARDLILAAPIILPDYPAVAPESPGDLFDATEIDEILTLRILTLTDAEKEEVRRGDERARRLLERTEALAPEQKRALHGTLRSAFAAGDRVRLRPRGRADILDLALEGKEATVVAVEQDFEGRFHVAVTVEDDPGSDLGRAGFPGHRFFFRPEDVERL